MIRSRAAASRAPAAPLRGRCAPLDPPARSQNPAAIRDREQTQPSPDQGNHDRETPKSNPCGHRRMQVRRVSRAGGCAAHDGAGDAGGRAGLPGCRRRADRVICATRAAPTWLPVRRGCRRCPGPRAACRAGAGTLPCPAAGRGAVCRERADLRRGRSGPPEHHSSAGGRPGRRAGCPGWTPPGCARPGWPTVAELLGLATFMHAAGIPAPSGSATWLPGWSRPARPRRSGCSGPSGDDLAGGVRGDHRRLRRRAADRGHAARRARPAAEGPHPAGRHVPDPGRRAARPPDPRAPGADHPARGRPAAARRDRGLEARPAPADLPADRVHLRPGRGRPRQGRAGRAALRPAAGGLRRPAGGIGPGAVQARQQVAGGGLDRPGVLLPAPAARHRRLRRPRGILGPPQEQPAAQRGRAVLRLLPVRRGHDARGERAGRPRARPPRHHIVMPARPGPRVRARADRDARRRDPASATCSPTPATPTATRAPGRSRCGRRRTARPGPAPPRPRPQGHPPRRHHHQRQPLLPCRHRGRCWNSGRSPAPPPRSRPRTGNARPPNWPATSSAASPATTPTATTGCSAPPPWARSAARSGPHR